MKKKKIIIISVIFIILFSLSNLIFGWPIITLYNNFLSTKFLNSLKKIEVTDKIKIVNSYKRFGILYGGGNHCDCEIAVMVESTMDINEFKSYVPRPLSLDAPFSGKIKDSYPYLYYVNDQRLFRISKNDTTEITNENYSTPTYEDEFGLERGTHNALINLIEETPIKNNMNYYIISTTDQTHSGINMYDIRCH